MTQRRWCDCQSCLLESAISKLAILSLAQAGGTIAGKMVKDDQMTSGLSIVLVIAATAWAGLAKPLAAQPLPPPPNNTVPFGQLPEPVQIPGAYTVPRELDFQAPTAGVGAVAASSPMGERYLVYVNNASALTLQQVRQVEPQAFIRNYNGQSVVQAGAFSNRSNADLMAATLQSQGFDAQVALPQSVVEGALPASTPFGPQASTLPVPQSFTPAPQSYPISQNSFPNPPYTGPNPIGNPTFSQQSGTGSFFQTPLVNGEREVGYYVVIPASAGDLSVIQQQIVGLGAPAESVRPRGIPRGPHVSVGPFESRSLADSWNRYLRNFGLDARVYYGR